MVASLSACGPTRASTHSRILGLRTERTSPCVTSSTVCWMSALSTSEYCTAASAACAASGNCQGAYERRILPLVIGNCDGASGGQTSVPVLGFGCFYLLQTVKQQGTEAQVFGQFISECEGDGYAGATPAFGVIFLRP